MSGVKDFFSFNKRERLGIITLLVLIFCCVTAIPIIKKYKNNKSQVSFTEFSEKIEHFNQVNQKHNHIEDEKSICLTPDSIYLFNFNPNTADTIELLTLGFNPKQVKNLINYRNKGGYFKKPDDLKKLWGMTDSLYLILEPYIFIPQKIYPKKYRKENNKTEYKKDVLKTENKKIFKININSADTTELKKLKGIGSKLAQRIVEFRDKAGGLYSIEQLNHIYGIKPEVYNEIKNHIYTDDNYKTININVCNAEELKNHPYINNWKIANVIINYRKKHGPYNTPDEIKKTDLVNDELYSKLAPYLVTE